MKLETHDPRSSPEATARSTMGECKSYRCYLIEVDRIRSYEQIECESDAEAALKAQELLAASPLSSAELWQGTRLVGKWGRTGAATPGHQNADGSN